MDLSGQKMIICNCYPSAEGVEVYPAAGNPAQRRRDPDGRRIVILSWF